MQTIIPQPPDAPRPRLTSQAFPSYTYIPGVNAHPLRESSGHSYGRMEPQCQLTDPHKLIGEPLYRFGIDLFNHGFYWEAHEAWEAVWLALGRTTPAARFVQALIKLAAAGVKVLEKNRVGVQRHATRATELAREAINNSGSEVLGGMELTDVIEFANVISDDFECADIVVQSLPTKDVFAHVLVPQNID